MKVVISHGQDINYVTFERRVQDPWKILHEIAQHCPSITEMPVKFSKRIPERTIENRLVYTLWDGEKATTTAEYGEAIRFLKGRKKGYPLLRDLLQKYLEANES